MSKNSEEQSSLELYSKYNATLRSWFVAFGIGGPVAIMANDRLFDAVVATGKLQSITILFCVGVAFQIIIAGINKTVNWCMYYGAVKAEFQESKRYKSAKWLSNQYKVDVFVDIATFLLFASAAILLIGALPGGLHRP